MGVVRGREPGRPGEHWSCQLSADQGLPRLLLSLPELRGLPESPGGRALPAAET